MTDLLQLGLFYLLVYFMINGLDDLSIDLRMARGWLLRRWRGDRMRLPGVERLRQVSAQRIAILVPLWRESAVIEAMVETNLRHVDYKNYDFFLGVYPNDKETLSVVQRLCAKHPRVHFAVCRRPGPTSKADCLNHVYREVVRFEAQAGLRFQVLMLHDAEDVLHPASLLLVNWYAQTHGMVQVPVLPIATALSAWTHGVYCDEFAEFFQRDLSVRQAEGGFLPSNGVGTAFGREHIEALVAQQGGILLDEESLTEDYEIGLKLHRAGCKQVLLPLTREFGDLLATREYFPRNFRDAVRQRSRWISGQCLQSWERNGWPLRWGQCYWFWRDRKGLLGNFLNALALLLLLMSVAAMMAPELTGLGPWLWIAGSVPGAGMLYLGCTVLTLERLLVRIVLVSQVYGWRFAAGVPVRILMGTCLNLVATSRALGTYVMARWRRKRLGWLKTEHAFPLGLPVAAEETPAPLAYAAAATGGTTETSNGSSDGAPLPAMARTVWLNDGEVMVVIPRNLTPPERERLMRRKLARLVFVEEDAGTENSATD